MEDGSNRSLSQAIEEETRLSTSNWLPLILIILLPNLGSILFEGDPVSWRDSIVFLFIIFFIYKLSTAPWQLYASARTHRIASQARSHHTPESIYYYPPASDPSLTELKSYEAGFLILAICSPSLAVGLLIYLQSKLDLGLDAYLNSNSTVLFLLSSSVKPLAHLYDRLIQRARYLQSQLKFPIQHLDRFNDSLDRLSDRLLQLEADSVSNSDLTSFQRQRLDRPIGNLSDRLASLEKLEESFQLESVSRLSNLEASLDQLELKLAQTQRSLSHLLDHQRRLDTNLTPTTSSILDLFDHDHHQPSSQLTPDRIHHRMLSQASPELERLIHELDDPRSSSSTRTPPGKEGDPSIINRSGAKHLFHRSSLILISILLSSLGLPFRSIKFLSSTSLSLLTLIIIRPIIQIYRSIVMMIQPTRSIAIRTAVNQKPPHDRPAAAAATTRLSFRSIRGPSSSGHRSTKPKGLPPPVVEVHDERDDQGSSSNSTANPSPASVNSSLILDPTHPLTVVPPLQDHPTKPSSTLIYPHLEPDIFEDHHPHPHRRRVRYHEDETHSIL